MSVAATRRSRNHGFAAAAPVTDTSWTACAVHDHVGFGPKPARSNFYGRRRHPFYGADSFNPAYRKHERVVCAIASVLGLQMHL
ncbi:hypothetical protein CA602_32455 [Paraburkholderia hospita]|nr:hypothetical protein CA602_32455 [Paraburkholderia hospita]